MPKADLASLEATIENAFEERDAVRELGLV